MAERSEPALTQRQARILAALCRDYIMLGTEVSSAGLIRTHGFRWSSATIREELAVLERAGLVHRPHRSSGRLPTPAGLTRYVSDLPRSLDPSPELAAVVDRGLRDVGQHLESDLRATSCVLSEVAGCVAVTFLGNAREGEIADIDVLPLVGRRALVVMTMEDRSTVMHPVTLDRLADGALDFPLELRRLRACLRGLCCGRTLGQARSELSRCQSEREARFDERLAEALTLGLWLCGGARLDPLWVQVAGQPRLAQQDHAWEVLELLEDVHRLADLLCQILPEQDAHQAIEARVRVGGDATPDVGTPVGRMTVVGCRLPSTSGLQGGRTGAVALLGSDRLDYAAVIPLVEYAARTLAAHAGS